MGTDEATARKWPAQAAHDVESPTGVILDRIADKWTSRPSRWASRTSVVGAGHERRSLISSV